MKKTDRFFLNLKTSAIIQQVKMEITKDKHILFVVGCLLLVVGFSDAEAQCSMCKAVAESAQDKNNITAGLNTGILYLLAIPYLVIGGLAVFFFRKPISDKLKSLKK